MATAPDPTEQPEPLEVMELEEQGIDPEGPDFWLCVFVNDPLTGKRVERHWAFYSDEVAGPLARELRHETGYGLQDLYVQTSVDYFRPDPDVFAALLWLARRMDGERDLSFDLVDASITFGGDWRVAPASEFTEDPASEKA